MACLVGRPTGWTVPASEASRDDPASHTASHRGTSHHADTALAMTRPRHLKRPHRQEGSAAGDQGLGNEGAAMLTAALPCRWAATERYAKQPVPAWRTKPTGKWRSELSRCQPELNSQQ